ncbi:MAG: hypothetical protein FJ077_09145 [Cyanobacteria bacterium K_DeepCast_35m_m2_023]|nr:hypothetical protein [Cyanobacteria bacterium K_DeepCast_35m_m2_023]
MGRAVVAFGRTLRAMMPSGRRPQPTVQFFRSTLLPAAIVLLFGLALFAVSARIWLPGDMAAPAPLQ